MRELIRKQWFVIALAGALILAFQFPEWGSSEGRLHSEIVSKIGIVLVFFFQGWFLPSEVLAKCMLRWKAHLFTQIFIFLVFPRVNCTSVVEGCSGKDKNTYGLF